jgi:hypothetical protein
MKALPGLRILLRWGSLCWCLSAPLLYANNPLALLPAMPFAAQENGFAGRFGNDELGIEIQGNGFYYHGTLEVGGQSYPLQATRQGEGLSGTFAAHEKHYPMRLFYQDQSLVLESSGRRHVLNRQHEAQRVLTGQGQEYTRLSLRTGLDLHAFVAALRYWLDGGLNEAQAVYVIEAHLLPGAENLARQLDSLEQLLHGMRAGTALSASENQQLHKLIELCNKGVRFFRDWQSLLQNLLRLRQAGDQAAVQQLAALKLPRAISASVAYLRDYMHLVRAAAYLQQSKQQPSAASLAPEKILKWETLRNMSEPMRDGLEMFKTWR